MSGGEYEGEGSACLFNPDKGGVVGGGTLLLFSLFMCECAPSGSILWKIWSLQLYI